jgi:hypothetical protein
MSKLTIVAFFCLIIVQVVGLDTIVDHVQPDQPLRGIIVSGAISVVEATPQPAEVSVAPRTISRAALERAGISVGVRAPVRPQI